VERAAYDPCYHQACDHRRPLRNGADAALYAQLEADYNLYGNVNQFAIDVNSDAIATAVITFANDTSSVNSLAAAAAGKRVAGPAAPTKDAHGNALL
jgi:hypothetical protein